MNEEKNRKFDSFINTLTRGVVFLIVAMVIIWLASNLFDGLVWLLSGLATIVGVAFIVLVIYMVGRRLIEESEKSEKK